MILAEGSDIHLEFGQYDIRNTGKADVLILSGDITVVRGWHDDIGKPLHKWSEHSHVYRKFFEQASKEFPIILYVMGNHEHYRSEFSETAFHLKGCLAAYPNVHLLNKETYSFSKEFLFFGATFWTDMNKCDPDTVKIVKYGMNDFQIVRNGKETIAPYSTKMFSPIDAAGEFWETVDKLEKVYDQFQSTEKFIVLAHHAPSYRSIHNKYRTPQDHDMNFGYCANLDEWIENHPKIKLWTHGHVHLPFDYTIGETRVVCNPRGYIRHEPAAFNFDLKYIEL